MHFVTPVLFLSFPSRITDYERARSLLVARVHQVPQIQLVEWRGNRQVGDRTEVSQVEHPVVRGTVFADQSGTVQADHHMQFLQSDVVYQVIVCPLHERGVDIAERDHSFFRQSGGESHRVTFGYPDIEGPLRECLHHIDHGTSGRHGGSDTHDPLILFRQFHQRMSEDVLI